MIIAKIVAGSQSKRKAQNKQIKATNGNGKNHIKLITWNKGNAPIENRMIYIKNIIKNESPHIFFINEAELSKTTPPGVTFIPGYRLEKDQLFETNGRARTIGWIKNNITYERNLKK